MRAAINLKPIETIYRGYRFRSRLEARWATFFSALELPWEYEKEGYDLEGIWYLPDFFLPTVGLRSSKMPGVWIEIKPIEYMGTAEDTAKYFRLYESTRYPLILFKGIPEQQTQHGYQHGDSDGDEAWWDNYMNFFKCYNPECNYVKIEFLDSNYAICPRCGAHSDVDHHDINEAVNRAKQARFERGHHGN